MRQKSEFLTHSLHILVLSSFAVAQPLFELLSRNPEFFVVRRSQPIDIILLIFILLIVIPGVAIFVEGIAQLFGQKFREGLHLCLVGSLVAGIFLPVLKKIHEVPGVFLAIGAITVGVVTAVAYRRVRPLRMFVTVISPSLLIFPWLFLLNPQVSKLIFVGTTSSIVYSKIDAKTPVVMVVFDEFPVASLMDKNRAIDSALYPNFAALAKEAYWFRNATAVIGDTLFAVPSILTGKYPELGRLPTVEDYPDNLFTLLGRSYELKVTESMTRLCPKEVCDTSATSETLFQRINSVLTDLFIVYLHVLLPTDMTGGLPTIGENWKQFEASHSVLNEATKIGADEKTEWVRKGDFFESMAKELPADRRHMFQQFIESIHHTQQPIFYFLHVGLPHRPWVYLPSGKEYGSVGEQRIDGLIFKKKATWVSDDWLVTQGFQRHLLQVRFVDKLVGELIARLKAVSLYDDSLIVIMADHGVSFRPNDRIREVTRTNYQDIMAIPLFMKVPNQRKGLLSDRNVETIDILPTIADILGVQIPWPIDGSSILDPNSPERRTKVILKFNPTSKSIDRFDYDFVSETKYDILEWKFAQFGTEVKTDGLFKIGPNIQLFGQPVSAISSITKGNVKSEIDHREAFGNVDLEAQSLPARITGHLFLRSETSNPLNLAIGVNGTIWAVTRTFGQNGRIANFSAMVPETVFRSGKNAIEVFIVTSGIDGKLRLSQTMSAKS